MTSHCIERALSGRRAGACLERIPAVNWVDLILSCVVALFGLRGFFRGFFREVFSLIALIAGFMVAVAYDQEIAAFASQYWRKSPLLLKGISFVAIFFVVYFLLNLAGWLLHRSEKLLFLRTLNRTGGIALGLAKGAAFAALAVFFLSSTALLPKPARATLESSYFATPLTRLGEQLVRFGKERVFADQRESQPAPERARL
jgi:membrane protein required for colicin V production